MDNTREMLCRYRFGEAKQCIITAKSNVTMGDYKAAANRSYYAFFHLIRSILALDEIDFKKHSAVIAYFRKEYIKSSLFERKYSDMIGNAFDIRGDSDNEDFFVISKNEVEEQIKNAEDFCDAVENYLKGRIISL